MFWSTIKKPFKLLIGWSLFLAGAILAPLPLPIGQVMALVGLSLLVSESDRIRTRVQRARLRLPALCRQLKKFRARLPRFLQTLIDTTDPLHLDRHTR